MGRERRSDYWHVLVRLLDVEKVFGNGETNQAGVICDRFLEGDWVAVAPVVIAEVFEEAGEQLVWL